MGFEGQNDIDIETTSPEVAKILEVHHEVDFVRSKNFLDNLVSIAWHLDEPIADPNVTAIWKMAKMAASKTQTVFSGMGCDELFAGHSRYTMQERRIDSFTPIFQFPYPFFKSFLLPLLNYIYPPAAYELLKKSRTDPWQYEYLHHNAIFDMEHLTQAAPQLAKLFDPEVFLHKFYNLKKIKSTVSSFLYFDVKTRLTDFYILQLKKLTAAHNLNWQTPYLDHHLFEYAASLPEPNQLAEADTAAYLKMLLKDRLPSNILNRPKRTRPNFLHAWANEPELKQVWKLLAKGTLVEMNFISQSWIMEQIETPKSCRKSFKFLWSILMLEIWFRLFINSPLSLKAPQMSVKDLLS